MVDVARHARHISLPNVGVEGQRKLNNASVLLIGAGGLGSPAALYLAAAGVGRLGLVDNDAVDLSNLQRQILHATKDVGQPKVASAKASLEALDPNVKVEVFQERLNPGNAMAIMKGWDIVIDGTDNLPTRYLIDDACSLLGLPWVYGSVFRFEGQVSLFNHNGGPCYRDLFPEPPPAEAVPTCSEAGVFGVLPGVIGVLQATEAIKLLLGLPVSLSGKLLLYDAQSMAFDTLTFEADPEREAVVDLSGAAAMLSQEAWCMDSGQVADSPQEQKSEPNPHGAMFNHISVAEFLDRRENGWTPFILDVRSDAEYADARAKSCDLQVPHSHVRSVLDSLPKKTDILIHCKSGMRSQLAAIELIQAGWAAERLFNLDGGIMGWHAAAPDDIE
ncbi:MAG: molybdenum cofactor biosynthesis protein MoeB [Euryarchaeota archaeon]|nr:molybdenum cofactor biosynthesis protein MoeB [Euryarchaeota archaeon]|tara:strand:- start:6294 stop:7460 length:1167 start_codon:yes stop_codon:yes gene_type:complete